MNKKLNAVIITAAGSSTRMGGNTKKEFLLINGKSVLENSITSFLNTNQFDIFIITLNQEYVEKTKLLLNKYSDKAIFVIIEGGKTRQESVFNALEELEKHSPATVLVHDGARPWIKESLIKKVLEAVNKHKAAVPVCPSVNAMKKINKKGWITEHLERTETVSAQTPQGFQFSKILSAHKKALKDKCIYIDDTEIYNKYSGKVFTVQGDPENIKITYKKDIKQ